MLRTRVITAIMLLVVVLPLLFFGSAASINLLCALFFTLACWESLRLFGHRLLIPATVIWAVAFVWLAFMASEQQLFVVWLIGTLAWSLRFIPALKFGLPERESGKNQVLSGLYCISVMACFLAMAEFRRHSATYLLSVMSLVWIADIGAYFFGKAFGKRKLAPAISPGKSWEGVAGGWICVLFFGVVCTLVPSLSDSFSVTIAGRWGWPGLLLVLSLLTAVSVMGDLVESMLKRRAMMKDSSQLLPGHGGVLDRVDALIPVLPLALLLDIVSRHPSLA